MLDVYQAGTPLLNVRHPPVVSVRAPPAAFGTGRNATKTRSPTLWKQKMRACGVDQNGVSILGDGDLSLIGGDGDVLDELEEPVQAVNLRSHRLRVVGVGPAICTIGSSAGHVESIVDDELQPS